MNSKREEYYVNSPSLCLFYTFLIIPININIVGMQYDIPGLHPGTHTPSHAVVQLYISKRTLQ